MPNDDMILPSASSLSTLTIADQSKYGFGYNPSVGPASNAVDQEASNILLNRKTINLTPTSGNSIYNKSINKKPNEVSLSSLAFLYSEMINWSHSSAKGIQDLEQRLNGLGYQVGQRFLELVKLREGLKYSKREINIIEILHFIRGNFWKAIFGRQASELEKSQDINNEYMIIENEPLMSKFISVPKEYENLNCSAFSAGIIEGALDSAFFPATVTAHSVPREGVPLRTAFLIKFDDLVIIRESLRHDV